MNIWNPFKRKFPKNFTWGTATAAFQIEGHPDEYALKLSDWSKWIDREDKVLRPTNDGKAVKHYEKMSEDIDLIKNLHNNAYRFSFNWATLHRGKNEFDFKTLEFYQRLIDKLLENRIKPFATLVHFVLPEWLAREGGWENPNTAYEFENFSKFLLKYFGTKINFWITHNEPNIFLWFGYESGIWPPGYENNWQAYLRAYEGLFLAHQLAYKAIKEHNSQAQIGFSQNMYAFETAHEAITELNGHKSASPLWQNSDCIPSTLRKQLHNLMFVESCIEIDALDFLGINYYTRFSYKFNGQAKDSANTTMNSNIWGELQDLKKLNPEKISVNSLNWELYPKGLYKVLTDKSLSNLINKKPVFITENGYCSTSPSDIDDDYRITFIQEHLNSVYEAIQAGINVQGYFYWSLLDNFEWALGMAPRFGLVHVDHQNFKRSPKKSYHYYATVAKHNCL
jgi:beta-glucosidase